MSHFIKIICKCAHAFAYAMYKEYLRAHKYMYCMDCAYHTPILNQVRLKCLQADKPDPPQSQQARLNEIENSDLAYYV